MQISTKLFSYNIHVMPYCVNVVTAIPIYIISSDLDFSLGSNTPYSKQW